MRNLLKIDHNTMGTDYVVGDIHGCYSLLMTTLTEIGFDQRCDRLFSVGDLVDRGPESFECMELMYQPWFFAVKGNHERMMLDALHAIDDDGDDYGRWLLNGGTWSLNHDWGELKTIANDVLAPMPLAIELDTGEGRLGIIHADVTSGHWGQFNEVEDIWSRSRIKDKRGEIPAVEGIDAVVVGHTILDAPTRRANVLYIDTGAFHADRLTIIKATDAVAHETRQKEDVIS